MMAVEQFCAVSGTQLHQTCSGNRELYNLGQLVTVQGKISTFREQRQLTVDFICIHFLIVNISLLLVNLRNRTIVHKSPIKPPLPLVSHPLPLFRGRKLKSSPPLC